MDCKDCGGMLSPTGRCPYGCTDNLERDALRELVAESIRMCQLVSHTKCYDCKRRLDTYMTKAKNLLKETQ